jgi:uncharacterized protein YndB with AHSA1/START domain
MADLIANASITVNAAPEKVWKALVDPRAIKEYMFGTNVASEWKKGGKITWKGEWQGRPYEDKGTILDMQPGRRLQYSHFSPLTGKPDKPENYHTVTIDLSADGPRTRVSLSQNNNATEDARAESQKNWEMMLGALKKHLEGNAA